MQATQQRHLRSVSNSFEDPTHSCRIATWGFVLLFSTLSYGETLRVASWNVTNYSGGRVTEFQTAIYGQYQDRSMAPDIFVGQEFLSNAAVNAFLTILNTAPGSPSDWEVAPFVDGPDTDSALFFRSSRVALSNQLSPSGVTIVATGGASPNHPRHIIRYDVVMAGADAPDGHLAIYSTHMKSGSSSEDQSRRLLEAQRIRNNAELLPQGWHFLIAGDYNIQSSGQAAYQELVASQADNRGRFFDPIATPGSWNNSSAFAFVHTQDPAGAGGMDDRHDQILLSGSLIDSEGVDYVGNALVSYSTVTWNDLNHSYRSWGNDGSSFDASLRTTGNQMVGPVIAQALITSATSGGHLPVFLDLEIPTLAAAVPAVSTWGIIVFGLSIAICATLLCKRRSDAIPAF